AVVDLRQLHGTTKAEPIVIPAHARTKQAALSVVREWDAGVQRFIHKVVVARAVELIRPGAHGDVEEAATGLPEFRGEVAGLNGEFLNCFHAGLRRGLHAGTDAVRRVLTFYSHGLRIARES